ncbi:hypothetical protein CMO91_06120 [Candidatus Woesearchaeota archaeon]|jgi:hypothetical protein|nr:hypothetical protein [Candidatus Woesearchaeota archaeon]|tara:strand:- start:367 stop:600 length:234 start_codon:yes stop_codon:yes gene_type:complete
MKYFLGASQLVDMQQNMSDLPAGEITERTAAFADSYLDTFPDDERVEAHRQLCTSIDEAIDRADMPESGKIPLSILQ